MYDSSPGHKVADYAIYKLISREPAGQRMLNDPNVQQTIHQTLARRPEATSADRLPRDAAGRCASAQLSGRADSEAGRTVESAPPGSQKLCLDACAGVLDRLVGRRSRFPSHAVAGRHNHHIECVARQHAGIAALARAQSQRARRVVPVDRDGGMRAPFVAIAVALVFIEREIAIGSGIDAQLDGIGGLAGVSRSPGRGAGSIPRAQRAECDRAAQAR